MSIIDRASIVLAERMAAGDASAEVDLKKIVSTIKFSDSVHMGLIEILGRDSYRKVVS